MIMDNFIHCILWILFFFTWSFSLDYISHMNCNKYVKFLVWMREMFVVWGCCSEQNIRAVQAHPNGCQHIQLQTEPGQQLRTGSTKMRKLVGWDGNGLISEGKRLELTFPWVLCVHNSHCSHHSYTSGLPLPPFRGEARTWGNIKNI